jgi:hypothetical protein
MTRREPIDIPNEITDRSESCSGEKGLGPVFVELPSLRNSMKISSTRTGGI